MILAFVQAVASLSKFTSAHRLSSFGIATTRSLTASAWRKSYRCLRPLRNHYDYQQAIIKRGLGCRGGYEETTNSGYHKHNGHQAHSIPPQSYPPDIDDLEQIATNELLDDILDNLLGLHGGIVVEQYSPMRWWLWSQWRSTLFQTTLWSAVGNMLGAAVVAICLRKLLVGDYCAWRLPDIATATTSIVNPALVSILLQPMLYIWKGLLGITSLVLMVFVMQALTVWRSIYDLARNIQYQQTELFLLLAANAQRQRRPRQRGRRETGAMPSYYTPDAQEFLETLYLQGLVPAKRPQG